MLSSGTLLPAEWQSVQTSTVLLLLTTPSSSQSPRATAVLGVCAGVWSGKAEARRTACSAAIAV